MEAWEKWENDDKAFILANPTDSLKTTTLVFDPADYDLAMTTPTLVDVYPPITNELPLLNCAAGSLCKITLFVSARTFAMVELR